VERVSTADQLRARVSDAKRRGERIGLVPTMGALHAGHLALVRRAAEHADTVVVSIFVNPTQFDRPDDLEAYPRDLEGDEAALGRLGDAAPALVFAPEVDEIYRHEPLTTVHVAGLTERLCGVSRPGHFDGVATVVAKLFNLVQPDVAVFGRKDAQQLQVIRRMVVDLDVPVELVETPTVREPDGLALSSRNRRLSAAQRVAARSLPLALRAAVVAARRARDAGLAPDPAELERAARQVLSEAAGVRLEYLEVVDPGTLAPPEDPANAPRLLVALAASLGPVRLIDNVEVGDHADEERLLAATRGSVDPTREG
jgi:pantoate--beta-alanine ligase